MLVIANADDGIAGPLDHFDEGSDATLVPATHSINLVHDDDNFPLPLPTTCERNGCVLGYACRHFLDHLWTSRVRSVELQDLISPLQLGYKSASCSLPDPWWPAHQCSSGVQVVRYAPVSKGKLLALPTQHYILPVLQPICQLPNGSLVPKEIFQLLRREDIDPVPRRRTLGTLELLGTLRRLQLLWWHGTLCFNGGRCERCGRRLSGQ
mmetsp:Transcript_3233/g.7509  ORF Transcript_3233/g.7509 Transcript_3233/m.7509 type:complete len:209 (-) Transcript_3233:516-1142(-)